VAEEPDADTLRRQLHELNAEIEDTRRRLWAVEHGIAPSDDPAEVENLRSRLTALGDRFVVAYREWQEAEAEEPATLASDARVTSPSGPLST
jgi:hypothetical protein